MTEEQLLEILRVSKEKQIPEKEACKEIMGKYYTLSYSINTKYLLNIRNKKQSALDKGEINIEDET